MPHGLLIVLSGCSGAGKNSVLRELLNGRPGLVYSISATTRPPRPNEINGRDYFFLSDQEFLRAQAQGEFLESARVYDHYYGTPKCFVDEALAGGKSVVLDVDVAGAMSIRAKKPEAVLIFLLPPSLSVLRTRLVNRRTDPEAEIEKRLAQVDIELQSLKHYDYIVINDDLTQAGERIHSIIEAESCAVRRHNLEELIKALREEGEGGPHDQSTFG